jgi:hypothetical protein
MPVQQHASEQFAVPCSRLHQIDLLSGQFGQLCEQAALSADF